MPRHHLIFFVLIAAISTRCASATERALPWTTPKEFEKEAAFTQGIEPGIRFHVNAPRDDHGNVVKATRLIVYVLPNGNTIEQTLGCQAKPGIDWHYDIQHVAAQTRLLRTLLPEEKIVLICAEAPGLSWPTFRRTVPEANAKIAGLVKIWRSQFGDNKTKVTLTGHSGGGSFMFGVIEGSAQIPSYVDRIAFLDANYSFDAKLHADKIERWLNAGHINRFIVICYDDREIMLGGKKVVGPDGGTFRATNRMRDAFGGKFELSEAVHEPFQETTGLDGRLHFYTHSNPSNKILHTVLVGEMNGLIHIQTVGTPLETKWGTFGGPRAYSKYVQTEPTPRSNVGNANEKPSPPGQNLSPTPSSSAPSFPPRRTGAVGGAAFAKQIAAADLKEREEAIFRQIASGNVPGWLRKFIPVKIRGRLSAEKDSLEITTTIDALPDYLAIGSDDDFIRMPMTPQTAQKIADHFGCILPTRKLVDAIDAAAAVRIAPRPMTQARESVDTFAEHNRIIESQRGNQPLGQLITGIKKDIVLTPRIFEKPNRLAIYGWRQLDGRPIQPLTIVHWNGYVDYSHGVRLIRDTIQVDGQPLKIADLLADPACCSLISDEGPMQPPRYPAN